MPNDVRDEDILVPVPQLWKIGGEELRQAPLPTRRLLEVVRYVEKNLDVIDKAQGASLTSVSGFAEAEVFPRLNGLLRLLFWDERQRALLTDEWCADHLTPAHYRAIVVCALKQNELWGFFQKAKEFLGGRVAQALRQLETPPSPSGSST